ncbi:MAG: hypothetical protein HKN05_09680 [Rhizobiales bacterium]|nr:hypothetical protein [Hyphomicrobiales bacterium]
MELRNQITLSRLYAIDVYYSEYEANLTRERQDVGFYSTVASLALTSAGTLVGGAQTKAVLHAVVTGLTGTREAYEKDILIEKTVSILQKQMRARRLEIKAQIVQRLQGAISVYPLEFALTDLERYYRAGTITGALIGVETATSIKLEQAVTDENAATMRAVRAAPARAATQVFRPRRRPGALVPDFNPAARVTDPVVRQLQAALCAPQDGFRGPLTVEAIKIYQAAEGQPVTGRLRSQTETDKILNQGACDTRLKNFMERSFLRNDAGNEVRFPLLRAALAANAQDAALKKSIEDAETLEELRPHIAKLRAELGGSFVKTGMLQHQNTELTPDLAKKIFP